MTGITDLPQELITMIAVYLNRTGRFRFASTCQHIYRPLTPHLWKEIYIQSDFPHYSFPPPDYVMTDIPPTRPVITYTRLEQHAPLVHRLSLSGPFRPEYYTIKFPRLNTLDFHYGGTYHAPPNNTYEIDHDLDAVMIAEDSTNKANFIRLNPTIKDLQVVVGPPQLPADFWDAISTTLDNPVRLMVTGLMHTHGDELDAFWKACSLFEELNITATAMGYTSTLLQLSFPRLKRVSLDAFCLDFEPWMQIGWLERCPNLTQLHWKFIFYEFPATKFMAALKQNTWPYLEDLLLDKLDERDYDLARTLAHLPPLRRFRLRSAKFGPATFSTLRERLFGTIRDMDMTGVVDFTSWMAVSVLQECVHLEEFKTVIIIAEDIDNDSRPWVCRGLKRLETTFICRCIASNEKALESLSRLTNLEYLDIGHKKQMASVAHSPVPEGAQSLRLVLDRGLSRLAPLKKLRIVGLLGTEQEMTEEDLRWMHESWPALEEVRGSTMRATTNTSG